MVYSRVIKTLEIRSKISLVPKKFFQSEIDDESLDQKIYKPILRTIYTIVNPFCSPFYTLDIILLWHVGLILVPSRQIFHSLLSSSVLYIWTVIIGYICPHLAYQLNFCSLICIDRFYVVKFIKRCSVGIWPFLVKCTCELLIKKISVIFDLFL